MTAEKIKTNINTVFKNKKSLFAAVIAAICIVFLIISELFPSHSEKSATEKDNIYSSEAYVEETEKKLCSTLEKIDGAGKVSVMITLESFHENEYAKGYSVKSKQQGENSEYENDEQYILVNDGSNKEECLVVKVYEPEIKGVAVVAEGAGEAKIKRAITDTVCALFSVNSARVSVEKMKNQK